MRSIRNVRAEAAVEPARWIAADIYAGNRTAAFEELRPELAQLARIADDQLTFKSGEPDHADQAVTVVAADVVATLPLAGLVDLDAERVRLEKELIAAKKSRGERRHRSATRRSSRAPRLRSSISSATGCAWRTSKSRCSPSG